MSSMLGLQRGNVLDFVESRTQVIILRELWPRTVHTVLSDVGFQVGFYSVLLSSRSTTSLNFHASSLWASALEW